MSDFLVITHILYRGAEAACSARGSPSDSHKESDLHLHLAQVQVSDFHELRQGFIPLKPKQVMEYNILDFSDWENQSAFDEKFAKLLSGLDLFFATVQKPNRTRTSADLRGKRR
jgi:hypothetical protein